MTVGTYRVQSPGFPKIVYWRTVCLALINALDWPAVISTYFKISALGCRDLLSKSERARYVRRLDDYWCTVWRNVVCTANRTLVVSTHCVGDTRDLDRASSLLMTRERGKK